MSDQPSARLPYLRRVMFLDTVPDDINDPPVHVTQKLLLDGVEHGEVMARDGWQVFADGSNGGATVVSFVAFAEHVTLKTFGRDGSDVLTGTHIAGIPVLTTSDHPWEKLPGIDGQPELVRVFFFAREIEVVAVTASAGVPA